MIQYSKRGWSKEEDGILREFIATNSKKKCKWIFIAKLLQNKYGHLRTGKMCRERWYHHLNPVIIKKQWTKQEQKCLFQMQSVVGNKWAQIALHLPGRSDNAAKNYFYSKIRRVLTKINSYLAKHKKAQKFKAMKQFQSNFLSKLMVVVEGKQEQRDCFFISQKTDKLAKQIYPKILEICNQCLQNVLWNENDVQIDSLINMMHEFRRNCKKKKKKSNTKNKQVFQSENDNISSQNQHNSQNLLLGHEKVGVRMPSQDQFNSMKKLKVTFKPPKLIQVKESMVEKFNHKISQRKLNQQSNMEGGGDYLFFETIKSQIFEQSVQEQFHGKSSFKFCEESKNIWELYEAFPYMPFIELHEESDRIRLDHEIELSIQESENNLNRSSNLAKTNLMTNIQIMEASVTLEQDILKLQQSSPLRKRYFISQDS